MAANTAGAGSRMIRPAVLLTPAAVYLSALLVFLVQPMVAKLLLPMLGGASAVWNTSLVFFQAALLLGYAYAHALQRVRRVQVQAALHLCVLSAAATTLPLRVSAVFGPPPSEAPALWLLAVLAVSIGAPFAALSATAPLLQAWWAARFGETRTPYALYAASNLGSLAALLSYPLLLEPLTTMAQQRWSWTAGYALFVVVAATLGLSFRTAVGPTRRETTVGAPSAVWRRCAWWALLGAIPSSLLLGVTSHITTDVASAPFLWVLPLGSYLLTFVLVFQDRPPFPPWVILDAQGLLAPACLILTQVHVSWLGSLALHLGAFFFTAMLCHARLAADRPDPRRLTEFYLALSAGGVLGGAFNALLAPQVFDLVWEYPLALIAASVARPLGRGRSTLRDGLLVSAGVMLAAGVFITPASDGLEMVDKLLLAGGAGSAFLLRDRAAGFAVVLTALLAGSVHIAERNNYVTDERSFFGVYRIGYNSTRELGPVKFLNHGTTLHGAQATDPARRCTALTYYAPGTPMQQAVAAVQRRGPTRIGVVGLGTGTLATYARPGDFIRFYEIDPVMADLARSHFSYINDCARGAVDIVIGDARLTVGREPAGTLDLLVVDAFSSDAVPTHLMTREAMQGWLRALKPEGLLVLHVSNQHLALQEPVTAALQGLGVRPDAQFWSPPSSTPAFGASASRAVAASRDPETINRLRREGAWTPSDAGGVRAWTDDRLDVLSALIRGATAR